MSTHAIEKLLPKSGHSVYRLVRMAANRALELSEGKKKLIEEPTTDKITTTALEEIAEGLVVYKDSTDHLKKDEEENVASDTQLEEALKE